MLRTLSFWRCAFILALAGTLPCGAAPPAPEFVTEAGFYPGPLTVEIAAPALVRYTLDGSLPTAASTRYDGPIALTRTAAVRVRAFDRAGEGGPVATRSFFVGADHHLPVVSLTTEPRHLWDEEEGIYVLGPDGDEEFPHDGANFWQDWERPVHVEFFEPDGQLGFALQMGMKIFGGRSRSVPQKSLSLFARKRYGVGTLRYPFFPGLGIERFEAVVLRNSGNDWGFTFMRDALATRLAGGLGIDVQAYRPAVAYINGAYWGIHNIREKVNEHFLASHHPVGPDEVELLEIDGIPIHGTAAHYRRLIDFVQSRDLADAEAYAHVRRQMDVDNFRDYQIVQIYAGNTDWPGSNIKFWRPQRPWGRWRWVLFDVDFGFGRWPHTPYSHNTLAFATATDGPSWPNPPWATLLLRSLLQNPTFRADFIERFVHLLNSDLGTEQVVAQIEAMRAVIAPEIPAHTERWGGTPGGWGRSVDGLAVFARNRPLFVRRHLAEHFSLGRPVRLSLAVTPPAGGRVQVNEAAVGPAQVGTYLAGMDLRLAAIPAKGYRFAGWGGIDTETPAAPQIRTALQRNTVLQARFTPSEETAASVVINEINYRSAEDFDPGDWIELFNAGAAPVDVGGWTLSDESSQEAFVLPEGTALLGGGYLVLCRDRAAFARHFPLADPCLGDWTFGLGRDGERVLLADRDGQKVDALRYGVRGRWPRAANGGGATLALIDAAADNGKAASWAASLGHGTPGAINAVEAVVAGPPPVLLATAPNPFNGTTSIRFTLAARRWVRVAVYGALGQEVAVPLAAERGPGTHEVVFEAAGRASGVYFLRVSTADGEAVGKMVLLR